MIALNQVVRESIENRGDVGENGPEVVVSEKIVPAPECAIVFTKMLGIFVPLHRSSLVNRFSFEV